MHLYVYALGVTITLQKENLRFFLFVIDVEYPNLKNKAIYFPDCNWMITWRVLFEFKVIFNDSNSWDKRQNDEILRKNLHSLNKRINIIKDY